MKYPIATGQAATYLGVAEPRLNDFVRRGKVTPAPAIFAGRRLWMPEHVLQAAEHLGVLTDELRAKLEQEVASPS